MPMLMDANEIDPAILATFHVVQTDAPGALDGTSLISQRLGEPSRIYSYKLQDKALWRAQFASPIFSLATRAAGSILGSYAGNRFATEVSLNGEKGDLFCFTTMMFGETTLVLDGHATTVRRDHGLAWRPGPNTQLQIGDNTARTNIFFKVAEIENALEHLLDENLQKPLQFSPNLNWSSGLAASLKRQLDILTYELQQSDGLVSNPIALASMTDLLISLALQGAAHNYSDRLASSSACAVPAYIRRAEDFMRENCAEPIRMAQVAVAAGCSVGTLGTVFKRFRGRTPLGTLHAIRLDQARKELTRGGTGASIAEVARCYGFTNSARFAVAFRRRFGQTPSEAAWRGSRT
jgi:AraC-like DNA-binding protein